MIERPAAPGNTLRAGTAGGLPTRRGRGIIDQLPHEPHFYFNRASAYQAPGETAKAEADLQKAKALSGVAE